MKNSEKRIQELQNILEATKLLNASKDIDFILQELMKATLKLIDRADIGIIFLYDKESGLLKSKCSFGFNEMAISLKPGESITGITFIKKETLHLKSNHEMMELMDFMEPDNRKMLDEKIIKPMNDLQSSISCPLIHEDECVGVFVLDNYVGKDPLTEDDVYLAELISVQATIAIKNAEIHDKELKNQRELKSYSDMLEIEKNRYQYSTYLHNRFTEMILKKSTIDDIVREVSMLLQCDVFVIDSFYTITSFYGSFLVTREELSQKKSSLLDHMVENGESIHFSHDLGTWVLLYPITPANELMGWVGVILKSEEIKELDKIAIEKCTNVVALDMIKQNEMFNLEQSIKGDFFDNLMNSGGLDSIDAFSKRYKIDLERPHRLLLIRLELPTIQVSNYKLVKHLYEEVNGLALQRFKNSLSILKGNMIIILLDDTKNPSRSDILSFHQEVAAFFNDFGYSQRYCPSLSMVVSERIDDWKQLRTTYDYSYRLFDLAPSETLKDNCVFYEDFEVKRFLLKADQRELEEFAAKVFSPLTEYPGSSRYELFQTLKVYIKSCGNWSSTKDILHIHGNTLTYRLSRVKDILGLDLDDYEKRLKLQLAFEIISLYPELEKKICPDS